MKKYISPMYYKGKTIIIFSFLFILFINRPAYCQEPVIKREITLYNPFKPSLPDVIKKSLLPDMTDTAKIRTEVKYDIKTRPFSPEYTISPLKAATMTPDPLSKLYNGYVKLGIGNYLTPLAEVSISNLRSKSGTAGFYANHFSTNGNIRLENNKKIFAGYMDNNASLYGRKFLRESVIAGNLDFRQKTRHAYGYNPAIEDYNPSKKDIRLNYYEAIAAIEIASMKIDSSDLLYNIGAGYNFFHSGTDLYSHLLDVSASAGKELKGFYASSNLKFEYYKPSGLVSPASGYLFTLSPSVNKKTNDWNVKLGAAFYVDKFIEDDKAKFHISPDLKFGFNIIPVYLDFFTEITGKLERNRPGNIVLENPFLVFDEIYRIRNTYFPIIVKAGLTGETGIEGMYRLSASYFTADNYILFANYCLVQNSINIFKGNYFEPLEDDVEILNLKGETSGRIDNHFTFSAEANYYKYTLTENDYAWGKPDWDAKFIINYNLREKIIAQIGLKATGARHFEAVFHNMLLPEIIASTVNKIPAHLNFNLAAEYRYTRILSFWLKFNNISFSRYYEWNWYPSLRFICLAGFTYNL